MARVSGIPHAQQVDPHAVIERPVRAPTMLDRAWLLVLALSGVGMLVFSLPSWFPLAAFAVWSPIWLVVQRPWARHAGRGKAR